MYFPRGITLKRVTCGEDHLRDLAPGQHISEETSQLLRAIGDPVFDLTFPETEPSTSRADSDVVNHSANRLINYESLHADSF